MEMNNTALSGNSGGAKPWSMRIVYIAMSLFFFGYVLVRAIWVGVTWDEVMTIGFAEERTFFDILVNKGSRGANNHILNTLLIKFLFIFNGRSLFLARLPNVISFVFYLYFSYKIAYGNLSRGVGVVCFFLLACNPFLLDFFGLARGYGLLLAFMMGALYFVSKDFVFPSLLNFGASMILGIMSVASVFSMAYFFVVLAVILNLIPIGRREGGGGDKERCFY